jgi:hypothetical protein
MVSSRSGPPSLLWAMIGHSTEEFHMTSDIEGGGDQTPLSQEARHGGFARPHHNHIMVGECSDHSGYGDDSIVARH